MAAPSAAALSASLRPSSFSEPDALKKNFPDLIEQIPTRDAAGETGARVRFRARFVMLRRLAINNQRRGFSPPADG
jgi:hypothetical protein